MHSRINYPFLNGIACSLSMKIWNLAWKVFWAVFLSGNNLRLWLHFKAVILIINLTSYQYIYGNQFVIFRHICKVVWTVEFNNLILNQTFKLSCFLIKINHSLKYHCSKSIYKSIGDTILDANFQPMFIIISFLDRALKFILNDCFIVWNLNYLFFWSIF